MYIIIITLSIADNYVSEIINVISLIKNVP